MTTDYRHEAFPPTYCPKCHHADGTHEADCPHRCCPHAEPCDECKTRECEE